MIKMTSKELFYANRNSKHHVLLIMAKIVLMVLKVFLSVIMEVFLILEMCNIVQ